jgi:hypothetical protein
MTEPPEGYRYCEPPSPGTVCQHKLCPGHPAVVTIVLRWPHAPSDRTKHLCAEHHALTLERIVKLEAELEDLNAMAREYLKKQEHEQQRLMDDIDWEIKTPEYWRNERGDTELKIEVMTAFLEGRGPFPVAEFLPTEEMSQTEIRDLAADYLEALREDLEMIDEMIAEILGKSRG